MHAGAKRSQVGLLILCTFLINSDQNLLAPNLSACAADFNLTEIEKDEKLGGGLAAGLFVVGAPAALVIGAVADGSSRRVRILSLLIGIGQGENSVPQQMTQCVGPLTHVRLCHHVGRVQ